MRLLNTKTLELKEFIEKPLQGYAILSHTWGDDEVLYEDMKYRNAMKKKHRSSMKKKRRNAMKKKRGYQKIVKCCELALAAGYDWVWIDTCCIDKGSSAELSEAINSMFDWYKNSDICYVYLEDVDIAGASDLTYQYFSRCRWVTRGWTLQELIAPEAMVFYSANWQACGTRQYHAVTLEKVTGVSASLLDGSWQQEKFSLVSSPLSKFSIAQRMSWAARRRTTRAEDVAYCLLGIFDVNMPLLYGEGEAKAFWRLQEEIMKKSTDHSLLSWQGEPSEREMSILAPSPSRFLPRIEEQFGDFSNVVPCGGHNSPYHMTNAGVQIEL
ncbi:heterokaryon incompatibility protein-domain-containing protein, partial [Hyaloscypha sp. PMI_1271]